jgi:hypothetical protein
MKDDLYERMEAIRKPTANPWNDTDTTCGLKKTSIGWVSFGNTEMNYRKYIDGTGWIPLTMGDMVWIGKELPNKQTIKQKIKNFFSRKAAK